MQRWEATSNFMVALEALARPPHMVAGLPAEAAREALVQLPLPVADCFLRAALAARSVTEREGMLNLAGAQDMAQEPEGQRLSLAELDLGLVQEGMSLRRLEMPPVAALVEMSDFKLEPVLRLERCRSTMIPLCSSPFIRGSQARNSTIRLYSPPRAKCK